MAKYMDFQNRHSAVMLAGSAVATRTSPSLDTKGMEQATVILKTGVITATGTLDVTIHDSADNSSFAALTGAVFAQLDGTDDDTILMGKIKCNRDSGTAVRRYLRVNAVVGTDTADYGCVMIGSNLSGHTPYVTNALPAPTFNIGNP